MKEEEGTEEIGARWGGEGRRRRRRAIVGGNVRRPLRDSAVVSSGLRVRRVKARSTDEEGDGMQQDKA